MNKNYPVEALLRPPIELWSAACAFGSAVIAALAPWALMMTPSVGYAAAVLLALFGINRLIGTLYIVRYHRNMRSLPEYSLAPEQIPVSKKRLFLGKGFLWQQKHTQRLRDTLSPKVRQYVEPSYAYRLARRLEIRWENSALLKPVAELLQKNTWWNPVRPLPPVGGKPRANALKYIN